MMMAAVKTSLKKIIHAVSKFIALISRSLICQVMLVNFSGEEF